MNASRIVLLLVVLLPVSVQAGSLQVIELVDGSTVRAEVISLEQGIYSVRSDSLGEMQIPAARIRSISQDGGSAASVGALQADSAQLKGLRESMVQDPATMGKIQSLQSDPAIKAILNDQDTMRAIHAGDLDALQNDPKIKALMENSTVRELTQGGL